MARSSVMEFRAISQSDSVVPVGVSRQSLELLGRVEALLVNTRNADSGEMLELSYCATLRCAGVLLNRNDVSVAGGSDSGSRSGSAVKRRRSATQSAWLRLRKERPEFDSRVTKFEQFAALREEVRLGISRRIDLQRAQELWDLSCALLGAVRAELDILPTATQVGGTR